MVQTGVGSSGDASTPCHSDWEAEAADLADEEASLEVILASVCQDRSADFMCQDKSAGLAVLWALFGITIVVTVQATSKP